MGFYSIYDTGTPKHASGNTSKEALLNYILENKLVSGDFDIVLGSEGNSDNTVREVSEHNWKAISGRKVRYKIVLKDKLKQPEQMVSFE